MKPRRKHPRSERYNKRCQQKHDKPGRSPQKRYLQVQVGRKFVPPKSPHGRLGKQLGQGRLGANLVATARRSVHQRAPKLIERFCGHALVRIAVGSQFAQDKLVKVAYGFGCTRLGIGY
jgi:hypothetical protein